jgi:hypothetical protein
MVLLQAAAPIFREWYSRSLLRVGSASLMSSTAMPRLTTYCSAAHWEELPSLVAASRITPAADDAVEVPSYLFDSGCARNWLASCWPLPPDFETLPMWSTSVMVWLRQCRIRSDFVWHLFSWEILRVAFAARRSAKGKTLSRFLPSFPRRIGCGSIRTAYFTPDASPMTRTHAKSRACTWSSNQFGKSVREI